MRHLIIAEVFNSYAAMMLAFDKKVQSLRELESQGLTFKLDFRCSSIEYCGKLIKYFSKDQWVENTSARWHYVSFNFEPTTNMLALALIRERRLCTCSDQKVLNERRI